MNCGAFVAGIIEGLLNAANFPARVTALLVTTGKKRTIYLIKFAPEVIARDSSRR